MPKRRASAVAKAAPRNDPREEEESSIEVRPDDILVGRGFQYEGNPGNAMFQEVIESSLEDYKAAQWRPGKTRVVKRIYDELVETSRFVRIDLATGKCSVCSTKEARQKISHALRYRSQLDVQDTNELDTKIPAKSSRDEATGTTAIKQDESIQEPFAATDVKRRKFSNMIDGGDFDSDDYDDFSIISGEDLGGVLGPSDEYKDITDAQQQTLTTTSDETKTLSSQQGGMTMPAQNSSVEEFDPLFCGPLLNPSDDREVAVRIGDTAVSSFEGDSTTPREDVDSSRFSEQSGSPEEY